MIILKDYQNQSVRLTEERLTHILQHPELSMMENAITETLKNPEKVIRSNSDHTVLLNYRFYTQTLIGDKWLCIVVKYLENDAFIITAYFTDRIKKGELLCTQM
jgi:hypothetical protein